MNVKFELQRNGFALIRSVFDAREVNLIRARLADYVKAGHPGLAYEADTETVRAVHGLHLNDDFFARLARHRSMLGLAEEVLGAQCYIHQFKVNLKQRFCGQSWPWHQDFIYWHREDGIARPTLLNAAIFLSDMPMLSGPLCVVPGSHVRGCVSESFGNDRAGWEAHVSQDLAYQVGAPTLEQLIEQNGVQFLTGEAGDLLVFDPLLVHSSSSNLSPKDRQLLMVTYNTVDNHPPHSVPLRRPEFLAGRDFRPLASIDFDLSMGVEETI